MKQIIPFIKDIEFKDSISEITSIALEHNLTMENDDSVVGNFIVSGKYKINDINFNEEDFEYNLPFDITLDDKYDVEKVNIDIDDFYYEIFENKILRVHIDVLVDNLIYLKKDNVVEKEKFIETNLEPKKIEEPKNDDERGDVMVDNTLEEERVDNIVEQSIGSNFLDKEEKYVTYKVHIIRDNETIDDIVKKYEISKEDIEKYNEIDNITMGSKIVIPTTDEKC